MATSRASRTILVHEWVTGGGLVGAEMPPSWAAEGRAMRRAIAGDFAADRDTRVLVTLDCRFDDDPGPWTVEWMSPTHGPDRIAHLSREADLTVVIAPETMGTLERSIRRIQDAGGRHLGSSPEAIALAGDKASLAAHLATAGIETPPSRIVDPREGLPPFAAYPAVLKPIDGAGAVDTFLVENPNDMPQDALKLTRALLQPLVMGRPMSASYLVSSDGTAHLLAVGEQDIVVRDGRFSYHGGTLPVHLSVDLAPLRAAVQSIPGLRGFVGVDFIWDDHRGLATVIEINPRPTTSIVALTRLLSPGRLAAAWIGSAEPGGGRHRRPARANRLSP